MRHEKAKYQKWASIVVLLLLMALVGFVVAGCSGGANEGAEGVKAEGSAGEKAEAAQGEGEATEGEAAEGEEDPAALQKELQRERISEIEDIALLYTENCGACHGHDGSGVVGPAINASALSAEVILRKIENGSKEMPQFKGGELSDEQIKALAEYVKKELK